MRWISYLSERIWLAVIIELIQLALTVVLFMLDLAGLGIPQPLASFIPWFGLAIFVVLIYVHIFALQSKLTPKMDLIFGEHKSCVFHYPGDYKFVPVLYRVGLINCSGKTIDDVRVSIEDLAPQGIEFGPIKLKFMHQRNKNEIFPLHPSDAPGLFVDVVSNIQQGEDYMICLNYATSGVSNIIEAGRYEMTLLAEGKDVPACRKKFWVDLNNTGNLVFGQVGNE